MHDSIHDVSSCPVCFEQIYARDNYRTPMQWSQEIYAGFSTQTPWLPVNLDYMMKNVEV